MIVKAIFYMPAEPDLHAKNDIHCIFKSNLVYNVCCQCKASMQKHITFANAGHVRFPTFYIKNIHT